jgi:hypothetical protein
MSNEQHHAPMETEPLPKPEGVTVHGELVPPGTVMTVADSATGGRIVSVQENTTDRILSTILTAAADPRVDVDKLDRLLAMQERLLAQQQRQAYTAAYAQMQPELPSVKERGAILAKGGGVQSTYALWEDVNTAIKPVLQKYGFALSFRSEYPDAGTVVIHGILSHRDGHSETTHVSMPLDTSGSKNATQAVGSTISYGKRYAAGQLLNLVSHGEDDDAQGGEDPVIKAWLDVIASTLSRAELADKRAEIVKDYGGKEKVPAALKDAVAIRMATLAKE